MGSRQSYQTQRPKQNIRSRILRHEALKPQFLLSVVPFLSEFMASNNSTLADGDGNYSDWIEVHNSTIDAIDLNG